MPRRSSLTILFLTDHQVVRADFSSGTAPQLINLCQVEQQVGGGLPSAVELAATLGPGLARRVFVLATEVWTQTLSISAQSIRGLQDEELSQALAFEVESLSGIESFQSRLAQRDVGGDDQHRTFWITQMDAGQMDRIEEVIVARGGKLVGIGSPVGLPGPVTEPGERRLEWWPGAICLVTPSAPPFISNADPRSDRWRRVLEQWESIHGPAAATHQLLAPGVSPPTQTTQTTENAGEEPGEEPGEAIRLDEPPALEQWLTAWARHLAGRNIQTPLLEPPRRPMSQQRRTLIAATLAAIVLAVCGAHWAYLAMAIQTAQSQTETLQGIANQVKNFEQQQAAAEKEKGELEKELTEIDQQWKDVQAYAGSSRDRYAALLDLLSQLHDEQLVITELTSESQGISLHGVSLTPDAATEMAKQMCDALLCCGWKVEMPMQEARKQLPDGGPWQFSILLRDVPPALPEQEQNDEEVAAALTGGELRETSFKKAEVGTSAASRN